MWGRGALKRERGQETANRVLKAGCVWKDSAGIRMGTVVASVLSWKPHGPHFDSFFFFFLVFAAPGLRYSTRDL